MRNPVRRYAWGSTDAIPELLGMRPDGGPQAELWIGAYEAESSWVRIDRRWHDLAAVLRARGEPRLPFLAKVTAIGSPLSLQIHPAAGPDPKTEMLYAWRPCRLLCGFRDVAAVRALLSELRDVAASGEVRQALGALLALARSQDALRDCLARLLRKADRRMVDATGDALWRLPGRSAVAQAVHELGTYHGSDPAVLAPLLLADFSLTPGEAILCRPGQPHTYLSGVGIEVQANSDAVVRAGLTAKPTDVDGFLAGLVTDAGAVRIEPRTCGHERIFAPAGADLALGVVGDLPTGPAALDGDVAGPQILFCVDGGYTVAQGSASVDLRHGESVFVPRSGPEVVVRGKGCLLRVSTGRAG